MPGFRKSGHNYSGIIDACPLLARTVVTLETLEVRGPLPLPRFGILNAANKIRLTDSFSLTLQRSTKIKTRDLAGSIYC